MPPSETATANTPLSPSVEKAYYRKCIQLKRRLNEVEAANDEAKVRRMRLERGIMKMRLERAFLLEQLGKRMDDADGSEGSGDEEAVGTPPPDRPHRDRRRRPAAASASQKASGAAPHASRQSSSHPDAAHSTRASQPPAAPRRSSDRTPHASSPPTVSGPGGTADARSREGSHAHQHHAHPAQGSATATPHESQPAAPPRRSPSGAPASAHTNGMDVDGAADERDGQSSTGPAAQEGANGDRKTAPPTAEHTTAVDTDPMDVTRTGE